MAMYQINTAELELLKKAIRLTHSRYDWGEYTRKFNFEQDVWDEDHTDEDRHLASMMREFQRTSGWRLTAKAWEADAACFICLIETARLIFDRYDWKGFSDKFQFTSELDVREDLSTTLQADHDAMYQLRQNLRYKRGEGHNELGNNRGAMMRVAATIEMLLYHAINSLEIHERKKFQGKPTVVHGYTRFLRGLEGLFFQVCLTINPDYKPIRTK